MSARPAAVLSLHVHCQHPGHRSSQQVLPTPRLTGLAQVSHNSSRAGRQAVRGLVLTLLQWEKAGACLVQVPGELDLEGLHGCCNACLHQPNTPTINNISISGTCAQPCVLCLVPTLSAAKLHARARLHCAGSRPISPDSPQVACPARQFVCPTLRMPACPAAHRAKQECRPAMWQPFRTLHDCCPDNERNLQNPHKRCI